MKKHSDSSENRVIRRVRKAAQTASKTVRSRRVLNPPKSELRLDPDPPILAQLKREVAHLTDEIERQQVLTQDHPTSGNHMADDASEVFEQTKNLALKEHLERKLEQLQVAMRRVENGTYGVCEKCGASIPVERLEVLPYATTCVACAKAMPHRPAPATG